MKPEEVRYPDMEGRIWPACRKVIDKNQDSWQELKHQDHTSIEIYRKAIRDVLDQDRSTMEILESQLCKVISISAYLIQSIETGNQPVKGYPYMLNVIWPQCKKILVYNAIEKKKGNSWEQMGYNDGFWFRKLGEEGYEYLTAKDKVDAKKELLDVINVCSFMLHNLMQTRRRLELVEKNK